MSAVLLIALISESAETLTVQVTVTVYFIFLFRVKRGRHAPDKKNSNSSRVHVQLLAHKLCCLLDLCVLKVGDEIYRRLRFARRLDDQAFVVFQRLQPTVQVLRVIRARSGANA